MLWVAFFNTLDRYNERMIGMTVPGTWNPRGAVGLLRADTPLDFTEAVEQVFATGESVTNSSNVDNGQEVTDDEDMASNGSGETATTSATATTVVDSSNVSIKEDTATDSGSSPTNMMNVVTNTTPATPTTASNNTSPNGPAATFSRPNSTHTTSSNFINRATPITTSYASSGNTPSSNRVVPAARPYRVSSRIRGSSQGYSSGYDSEGSPSPAPKRFRRAGNSDQAKTEAIEVDDDQSTRNETQDEKEDGDEDLDAEGETDDGHIEVNTDPKGNITYSRDSPPVHAQCDAAPAQRQPASPAPEYQTAQPQVQPNVQYIVQPIIQPSVQPNTQPNIQPSVQPNVQLLTQQTIARRQLLQRLQAQLAARPPVNSNITYQASNNIMNLGPMMARPSPPMMAANVPGAAQPASNAFTTNAYANQNGVLQWRPGQRT